MQLDSLVTSVVGPELVVTRAVIAEADPRDPQTWIMFVDATSVARMGGLVHLDQLGVQQGYILLAILSNPTSKTLEL